MLTDAPGQDVIEVSIFGPGKGESVLIHLGNDDWVIIDSCRKNGVIPPLAYLRQIGVDLSTRVRLLVVTHAHDDHFAGAAEIFEECRAATLVCSAAATADEIVALIRLEKRNPHFRASVLKEFSELHRLIKERPRIDGRKPLRFASDLKELLRLESSDRPSAVVTALSPSDEAISRSREALAAEFQSVRDRPRAVSIDPNELSVAVWVTVADKTLLLGADLEVGPEGCGWKAILSTFRPSVKASLFKVPHHGSVHAHHDGVWESLLEGDPLALLAPYRSCSVPRPAPDDVRRICGLTTSAFISASAKVPVASNATRREFAALGPLAKNPREPTGTPGQVRARSAIGKPGWTVELVPPARALAG